MWSVTQCINPKLTKPRKSKIPKHKWVVTQCYKNVWYDINSFLTRQEARKYCNIIKQNSDPIEILKIHHYILKPYNI